MIKRFYSLLIELLKEALFLIVLFFIMINTMVYGGSALSKAFEYKFINTATSDYAKNSYEIEFNKELYGTPGFELEKLGYLNFNGYGNEKGYFNILEINDVALNIFDIHNKHLLNKTDQNDLVRDALALPQLADEYKIGDIVTIETKYESHYINYPVRIVGYLDEKTHFTTDYKIWSNYKLIIFNHIKEINFEKKQIMYFFVHSIDGTSFYKENFEPFNCIISDASVYEVYDIAMNNNKINAKSDLYICIMVTGFFAIVMLLYAACKSNYFAKKYAVYNLYGEKKITRFAIESFKTILIASIAVCYRYFKRIYIAPETNNYDWWMWEDTAFLIVMIVVAVAFVIINTAVNTQIFFRKNLKKIGE